MNDTNFHAAKSKSKHYLLGSDLKEIHYGPDNVDTDEANEIQ